MNESDGRSGRDRRHNVEPWRKRNFANLMTNKYDYTESAGCSVFVTWLCCVSEGGWGGECVWHGGSLGTLAHNQHWQKVCLISSSTFPSSVGSSHLASMDTVWPDWRSKQNTTQWVALFFHKRPGSNLGSLTVLTSRQTWWPWIDLLYMEAQESILSTTTPA